MKDKDEVALGRMPHQGFLLIKLISSLRGFFFVLLILWTASEALGQELPFMPQPFTLNYDGWLSPDGTQPDIQEQHLNLVLPLLRAPEGTVSFTTQGTWLHFNQPLTLSTSQVISSDLWSIGFGGQFTIRAVHDQLWGGGISVGSASDHPFGTAQDSTISLNGFYLFPDGKENKWLLAVFLSNNSLLGNYIPIPSIAYLVHTKNFTGMFGLPYLMIHWAPADPWTLSLSAFGRVIHSEIALGSIKTFQGFTGFNWNLQSFIPEVRPENLDRLYFSEKRVFVGTRFRIAAGLSNEYQLGYAFDRSIYEATDPFKSSYGSSAIGNSLFVAWDLKLIP